MGRRKQHNEGTAVALLDAAETIVESDGVEALTVRRVAAGTGTTTRAVYSVFGSKDGLVVALGARTFDLLRAQLDDLPVTADPAADLVEAGVSVFRRVATEHPALFRIGVQQSLADPTLAIAFRGAAREALAELWKRVERLEAAGLLAGRSVSDAVWSFHSLCEGLAAVELRSSPGDGEAQRIWRGALTALVRGFALPA
jgi:AcrR family transcriptional regulator